MNVSPYSSSPLNWSQSSVERYWAERVLYLELHGIFSGLVPPSDKDWGRGIPIMIQNLETFIEGLHIDRAGIATYLGPKETLQLIKDLNNLIEDLKGSSPDPWEIGKKMLQHVANAFFKSHEILSDWFEANATIYNSHVTQEQLDKALSILERIEHSSPPLNSFQLSHVKKIMEEIEKCKRGSGDFAFLLMYFHAFIDAFLSYA